MFRIGEFSKLSYVTVKTLRYYDEVGLLAPARIDNFTGYRYYSASQLPRLNRILALKDMGLSLEQIKQLLNQPINPEQLHGMLRLKQVELQQQLSDGQMRLARIENWLTQFEQENYLMPAYDVVIKKVEPLRVAEVRGVAPTMSVIGPTLDGLFDTVAGFVKQNGGKDGVGITTYYDEELGETNVDVGAAIAYNGTATPPDGITVHELPGVETMASTIHRGSFAGLSQAYQAISQWIEANGYRVVGPNRELNLEYERGGDQSKYVTEIQFPVAKNQSA